MGLWDGEGQDLGPLGHRPCVDAVAGLGRVRVQVHLSGRGGMSTAKSGLGRTPNRPPLHSHHHLGTQQTWLVRINTTFSGALGWGPNIRPRTYRPFHPLFLAVLKGKQGRDYHPHFTEEETKTLVKSLAQNLQL